MEGLDFGRIADEEGVTPERYLRSVLASWGAVRALSLHPAAGALAVRYRTEGEAFNVRVWCTCALNPI